VRVLVTGATGNLGRKAVRALLARRDLEVVQVADDAAGDGADVVRADLAAYRSEWASAFRRVDVVLHLAGEQSPVAGWDMVVRSNVDLTINVMRAASESRVRRFVLASSNWVLAGYRFTSERLTSSTPPRPVNPYGVSKLLLERIGMAAAARTGTEFLALRIGYCQPGDNVPGPHMAFGRWGQEMWLSNEDWVLAAERACVAPLAESAVVHIMSDNAGMRWDLGEAERAIGYRPRAQHRPRMTPRRRFEDTLARLREAARPPMSPAPLFGARW